MNPRCEKDLNFKRGKYYLIRLERYITEVKESIGKRKLTSKPRFLTEPRNLIWKDDSHIKFSDVEGILSSSCNEAVVVKSDEILLNFSEENKFLNILAKDDLSKQILLSTPRVNRQSKVAFEDSIWLSSDDVIDNKNEFRNNFSPQSDQSSSPSIDSPSFESPASPIDEDIKIRNLTTPRMLNRRNSSTARKLTLNSLSSYSLNNDLSSELRPPVFSPNVQNLTTAQKSAFNSNLQLLPRPRTNSSLGSGSMKNKEGQKKISYARTPSYRKYLSQRERMNSHDSSGSANTGTATGTDLNLEALSSNRGGNRRSTFLGNKQRSLNLSNLLNDNDTSKTGRFGVLAGKRNSLRLNELVGTKETHEHYLHRSNSKGTPDGVKNLKFLSTTSHQGRSPITRASQFFSKQGAENAPLELIFLEKNIRNGEFSVVNEIFRGGEVGEGEGEGEGSDCSNPPMTSDELSMVKFPSRSSEI